MSNEHLRKQEYRPTEWDDRVLDENGNVLVEGTPVNETNLNNMETGILIGQLDVGMLATFNAQQIRQLDLELKKSQHQRLLQGKATISNDQNNNGYFRTSEPFVEIALEGYPQINAPDYDVQLTVVNAVHEGAVGELLPYEKTQNGFKVKTTGSAESVTFLWTLLNPNV
ncbi:signal transduction protein [Salimicrobium jeotgali]|uniref:Signal transduction protein n=1 Tax=Salimicrobium jeotgali TaxID=1230341 RepID=K2FHA2_9BACI|nr:hypothetical protein [Salimicrobium jeotgali]AKG05515.1 signal transduction protein [Salimicrobium jeotgali]EKE30501.1 hypothetical protein MJ3_13709 [Salimicrobium jeotgali]MBM7696650.1 hypothetical protein [Salimicrobium jeotgali]